MSRTYLRGTPDNTNTLTSNTTNDDSGIGRNSKATFTVNTSNVYYISAGSHGNNIGTYTLTVTGSNTTITTTYIGKLYEQIKQNTNTEHKHFIYADGQLIAINIKTTVNTPSIPSKTRYLHYDNLGSIDTITDGQGNIVERMAYTAFGQRRQGDWRANDPLLPIIPTLTNRGFTGHEHIDEMGFIHMNGRVYDPSIGRFLSADPNIQAPYNTQSYNRYSYTINNPLKYTDPDGYFFTAFIAATITKAIAASSMHILTQMAIAYAVSYVVTYVVTDSSKATQEAGLAAGLFMGIGGIRGGKIGANGKMQYNPGWESGSMKTLAAHGLAGGIVQDRMGGSFGAGFLAGSLGSYLGSSGNARNASELIGNTAREAIVGGTISVVGGGKFANGAQTGAFRYLFNESMHTAHTTTGKRKYSSVEELQKALGSDGTTFGKRPLKGSGGVMGVGPISDYYNSEFAHEQMFFTKGGELGNLGYFDDGVIHSDGDRQNDTLIQSYTFDPIIYHGLDSSNPAGFGINDYSLPFNNCQHYCDSIRKRF